MKDISDQEILNKLILLLRKLSHYAILLNHVIILDTNSYVREILIQFHDRIKMISLVLGLN